MINFAIFKETLGWIVLNFAIFLFFIMSSYDDLVEFVSSEFSALALVNT